MESETKQVRNVRVVRKRVSCQDGLDYFLEAE